MCVRERERERESSSEACEDLGLRVFIVEKRVGGVCERERELGKVAFSKKIGNKLSLLLSRLNS